MTRFSPECEGCKLIGFDITGLPESRAIYAHRTDRVEAGGACLGRKLLKELELMHDWAASKIA